VFGRFGSFGSAMPSLLATLRAPGTWWDRLPCGVVAARGGKQTDRGQALLDRWGPPKFLQHGGAAMVAVGEEAHDGKKFRTVRLEEMPADDRDLVRGLSIQRPPALKTCSTTPTGSSRTRASSRRARKSDDRGPPHVPGRGDRREHGGRRPFCAI